MKCKEILFFCLLIGSMKCKEVLFILLLTGLLYSPPCSLPLPPNTPQHASALHTFLNVIRQNLLNEATNADLKVASKVVGPSAYRSSTDPAMQHRSRSRQKYLSHTMTLLSASEPHTLMRIATRLAKQAVWRYTSSGRYKKGSSSSSSGGGGSGDGSSAAAGSDASSSLGGANGLPELDCLPIKGMLVLGACMSVAPDVRADELWEMHVDLLNQLTNLMSGEDDTHRYIEQVMEAVKAAAAAGVGGAGSGGPEDVGARLRMVLGLLVPELAQVLMKEASLSSSAVAAAAAGAAAAAKGAAAGAAAAAKGSAAGAAGMVPSEATAAAGTAAAREEQQQQQEREVKGSGQGSEVENSSSSSRSRSVMKGKEMLNDNGIPGSSEVGDGDREGLRMANGHASNGLEHITSSSSAASSSSGKEVDEDEEENLRMKEAAREMCQEVEQASLRIDLPVRLMLSGSILGTHLSLDAAALVWRFLVEAEQSGGPAWEEDVPLQVVLMMQEAQGMQHAAVQLARGLQISTLMNLSRGKAYQCPVRRAAEAGLFGHGGKPYQQQQEEQEEEKEENGLQEVQQQQQHQGQQNGEEGGMIGDVEEVEGLEVDKGGGRVDKQQEQEQEANEREQSQEQQWQEQEEQRRAEDRFSMLFRAWTTTGKPAKAFLMTRVSLMRQPLQTGV